MKTAVLDRTAVTQHDNSVYEAYPPAEASGPECGELTSARNPKSALLQQPSRGARILRQDQAQRTDPDWLPAPRCWDNASQDRALDWRWRRATFLFEMGVDPSPDWGDDDLVVAALEYQRAVARGKRPDRLQELWPEIHAAHAIHSNSASPFGAELEARLFARQTPAELSPRCRHSAQTLAAYERLFCDVRPHLDRPSAIYDRIGWPGPDGRYANDTPNMWKLFGYRYGPQVLDLVVEPSGFFDPVMATLTAAELRERARTAKTTRICLEIMSMRQSMKLNLRLIRLMPRLTKLTKMLDERRRQLADREAAAKAHIQAFVKACESVK